MSWEARTPAPDDGPDEDARPAAGPLWAVDEVQRQAVESANLAIERLLDLVGRAPDDPEPPRGATDGGEGTDPVDGFLLARATMARSVDLVLDLFRRSFDAYADLAESELRKRAGVGAASGEAAPVTLGVDAAGVARGTFWVHNTTDAPTLPEHARVTDLWAVDGGVVTGATVDVAPAPLPSVAPGGSVEVTLAVDVADAKAGRYVGHVLTSHGALALTVDLRR